jgi:hypothetical protein
MKRIFKIPDAGNCSEPSQFTKIPNALIRNPEISSKAKTILCILLSNSENWHSCMSVIQSMMKEKRDAIYSALNELEVFGYLKRLKIQHKNTKVFYGLFWAYCDIPFSFNYERQRKQFKAHDLLLIDPKTEKPVTEKPDPEKPDPENTDLKEDQKKEDQKKEETPTPWEIFLNLFPSEWITNEIFKSSLEDFIQHRIEKRSKLTENACKRLVKKLTKFSIEDVVDAIDETISSGWTGIFPKPKTVYKHPTNKISNGVQTRSNKTFKEGNKF